MSLTYDFRHTPVDLFDRTLAIAMSKLHVLTYAFIASCAGGGGNSVSFEDSPDSVLVFITPDPTGTGFTDATGVHYSGCKDFCLRMGFGYADAQVADAQGPGAANFLSCEGPTLATYVANDVDANLRGNDHMQLRG